ncbi:MAG: prepilin-type N-terminal cleavage/methylation domain-containing protein [Acidobacteriota bacterium]|nr:prepilin-type N-terminal cleavage/methylation domain-containing protein [Bryobacteraceae bacterium CoA2 C42]
MRRSSAGFTLLEVLVASVIMAVAIAGLLSNLTTSLRNAARLTEYDRAALLARHKMDELLVTPAIPGQLVIEGSFDPAQSGTVEAGWKARASILEGPPNAGPGVEILERIELQVWWKQGAKLRTFPLDGYRKRILLPGEVVLPAGGAPLP